MRKPRESKLERLIIPDECRTVKDWFSTRESAEAALPGIKAHILTTWETHLWPGHTHTKPPKDAVPVYIGEFELPDRFRELKHFAPCPCCWAEFGKFGVVKVAWFPEERIIRLIGPDCFRSLNPEAHEKAQATFDIEQARRRTTEFLLSNIPHLPQVIVVINRGIVVAKALESFHGLLHNRLKMLRLKLWPYVQRGGALYVNVQDSEIRHNREGEAYRLDGTRVEATLPGFQMLDPGLGSLSAPLSAALSRIKPYSFGEDWERKIRGMDDEERRKAATTLSQNVKRAKEKIADLEELRRFIQPVSINTLRRWGAHPGCPIPYNYSHDGRHILIGRSDYEQVGMPLPPDIQNHIGEIEFWTELERRRR